MMRRSNRIALMVVGLLAALLALWGVMNQPVWLPTAQQWGQQIWRKATRPDDSTLPAERRARKNADNASGSGGVTSNTVQAGRKCTDAKGSVTYTDQACPKGTQEQWMDDSQRAIVEIVPAAQPNVRGQNGRP